MTIEENYFSKMALTNTDNIESMDFVLNLDLLSGCVHSCDGCYINKSYVESDWNNVLENAYEVASNLSKKGLRFRELILGPTDFFSASNTIEVLNNPTFQNLLRIHEKTRITAACIFDDLNKENFEAIFKILDDKSKFKEEMILEFLIPLNSKKIIAKDSGYIEANKWAIDYFGQNTPKVIDWSYVVNIHSNDELKNNYIEVVETIKREFNTIVEFNPGFFRSNNNKLINKNLTYWKKFLQEILANNKITDLYLTNLDMHHNTNNTICLNFYKGGVFFSPFIYEQIIDTEKVFEVFDFGADSIIQKHRNLEVDGYEYAQHTDECSDCQYLTACTGRNVLNFMETKSIKHCLFPEQFRAI